MTVEPIGRISGHPFCSRDCGNHAVYAFDVAADEKGQCPPTLRACSEPDHLLSVLEQAMSHRRDVRVVTRGGLERVIKAF